MMKLYLVNCGYYEQGLMNGLFEMHVTLPIVAESLDEAKVRAKVHEFFTTREIRAHVDGIVCLEEVDGYGISLNKVGI